MLPETISYSEAPQGKLPRCGEISSPHSGDETHEYWPREVDYAWQEQMVLKYAPLIKYIASRLALRLPPHISLDDLISSGITGLMDAVHKFDPAKNIKFKTYAEFRIKGAILDELRSLDWTPRSVHRKMRVIEDATWKLQKTLGRPPEPEETAEFLGLDIEQFRLIMDETKTVSFVDVESSGDTLGYSADTAEGEVSESVLDDSFLGPLNRIYFSQLKEILARGIDSLPDKDKLLLSLYYYEELTMKEIGEIMGCGESRISQLHSAAIQSLREIMREVLGKKNDNCSML